MAINFFFVVSEKDQPMKYIDFFEPKSKETGYLSNFYASAAAPTTAPGRLVSTTSNIVVAINTENKLMNEAFDLDISSLVSRRTGGSTLGDVLWVSFERPGGDSYSGDFNLVQIAPLYTSWCNGAYRV